MMSRETMQLSCWKGARETDTSVAVYRSGSKKDWYGKELEYSFRLEISKVGGLSCLEIRDCVESVTEFKENESIAELLNEMERRIYEINKL